MNIKKEHNFLDSECISQELMFAYLDNDLSFEERHFVEKHLQDCEFCSDAMEGAFSINNRKVIQEIVETVKGKEKQGGKIISIGWIDYRIKIAAAATVLLFAGYSVYFNFLDKHNEKVFAEAFDVYPKKEIPATEAKPQEDEKQQRFAEKKDEITEVTRIISGEQVEKKPQVALELKQLEEDIIAEDRVDYFSQETATEKAEEKVIGGTDNLNTLSVDDKEEALIFSGNYRTEESASKINTEQNELSDKTVVQSKADVTKKTADAPPKANTGVSASGEAQQGSGSLEREKNQNDKAKRAKVADSRKDANSEEMAEMVVLGKKSEKKEPASRQQNSPVPSVESSGYVEENTQSNLAVAIEKYDKKNYRQAIVLFEAILKTEPLNEKALFYAAVSSLSLDNTEKAIALFDDVIKLKSAEFAGASKWYKALALIKKNEEKKARKLLNEIINEKGEYKKDAQELLLKLKK